MRGKIMLIDDEVMYGKTMGMLFRVRKYEYVYEEKGNSALERYKQEKPDMVLLDINLGEDQKNGWEVLQEIRAFDSQTPIIMITGMGGSDLHEDEVRKRGATMLLPKPVDMPKLFEILEKIIPKKE